MVCRYVIIVLIVQEMVLIAHPNLSFVLLGKHNYALSGQASQSSDFGQFYATRANDGAVGAGTAYITHTLEQADEWLKIELREYIYLVHMIIYNRDGDCSGNPCGKCAT